MNVTDFDGKVLDHDNGSSISINIGKKAVKYVIGSAFGIVIVLALTAIFSLVMTINAVPDEAVDIFPFIIIFGGAFFAGFIAAAKIGLNGMVNGAFSGLVFFIIQMLISLLFKEGSIFTNSMLVYLLVDVLSGAVGGIASVNIFKKKS